MYRSDLCAFAAKEGEIEVLEWLVKEGCPLFDTAREAAIEANHLKVLKWLITHGCPGTIKIDYSLAVRYSRHEIFKWLVEQKFRWDEGLPISAALIGNLDVLKWLREEGCPWDDERVVLTAVKHSQFEVLRWATQIGCSWPEIDPWLVVKWTYSENDIKVLQWIHDEGHLNRTNELITAAIARENLTVLRWCIKIGVCGTKDNCRTAAEMGLLDMLKLLRRSGTPWDQSVLVEAVKRKGLRMLKWIFLHGGAQLLTKVSNK